MWSYHILFRYEYRPVDLFLSMIDQSTVDESTELWLGEIEKKLRLQMVVCWALSYIKGKKIRFR